MTKLVWFRADLRVRDNTALYRACEAAERDGVGAVAVFTICPKQWKDEHDWADVKVNFILRNLRSLSESLAKKNIPLKIIETATFKGVPRELTGLANDIEVDSLWYNKEYELNELARDEAVCESFERNDREVHAFDDQVILKPGDVRTNEGKFYTVFSPFKKKWLETYHEQDAGEVLGEPTKQKPIDIEADDVPDTVDGFSGEHARPDLWAEGEQSAAGRLAAFCKDRIHSYHGKRNNPAINGTSTCSPYLAMGVLSPRQCLRAAAEANGGSGGGVNGNKTDAALWISELIWREFYKHILIGFPRVCRHEPFQKRTKSIEWEQDDEKFTRWCEGRTGYPLVDAAMRQLNQTGWMHNRLRMIAAMFLTKDLFLDWRLGEKYFMQRLVDGDLAANNGGWQWSASTGTDAQPYFRVFNPITQSEQFDKEGAFIRKFVPELEDVPAKSIHDPDKLGRLGLFDNLDYPEKIVDHKQARVRAIEAFKALG